MEMKVHSLRFAAAQLDLLDSRPTLWLVASDGEFIEDNPYRVLDESISATRHEVFRAGVIHGARIAVQLSCERCRVRIVEAAALTG